MLKSEEVKRLFKLGMVAYELGMEPPEAGIKQPEDRIYALGWRHAKKAALDLEIAIETVVEAYTKS